MSFDRIGFGHSIAFVSLNPFGTGQCLSTGTDTSYEVHHCVSIPLEQGNVFRQESQG